MADEKKGMSRRHFLKNAAVGAATVGAVTAAPRILALTENVSAAGPDDPSAPLMAYVKDRAQGTVVVMWGSKEFETRDPGLVARLARYAQG